MPLSKIKDWVPSDELDALPLGTADQERNRAKAWMDDAARYCRDVEYFREERDKLLRKYEPDSILLPENEGNIK